MAKLLLAVLLGVILLVNESAAVSKYRGWSHGSYCLRKCPKGSIGYVRINARLTRYPVCCADCQSCGLRYGDRNRRGNPWISCANPAYIQGNCLKCGQCSRCKGGASINAINVCAPGCDNKKGLRLSPSSCYVRR